MRGLWVNEAGWKEKNSKTWFAKDTQRRKARPSGYVRFIAVSVETADYETERKYR